MRHALIRQPSARHRRCLGVYLARVAQTLLAPLICKVMARIAPDTCKMVADTCKIAADTRKMAAYSCKMEAETCKMAADACKIMPNTCKIRAQHL